MLISEIEWELSYRRLYYNFRAEKQNCRLKATGKLVAPAQK